MSKPDRKWLKRPDQFQSMFQSLFGQLGQYSRYLVFGLFGLVVLVIAIKVYTGSKNSKERAALDALFLAESVVEEEREKLSPAIDPPTAENSKEKKNKPPKAPPKDTIPVAFKKVDVNATFSESHVKLEKVISDFPKTSAAYRAGLVLGNLFYRHHRDDSDLEKAKQWFSTALENATTPFEKATAGYSIGFAAEDLAQYQAAIDAYDSALRLGRAELKGDILLSMGRCHEALNQIVKARAVYARIIQELPGTPFEKTAKLYQALLSSPESGGEASAQNKDS